MELRRRSPGEESACVAMLHAVQRLDHYPSSSDLRGFLLPAYELAAWVAVEDGNLLGHVALHEPATSATIDLARAVTAVPFERHALVSRLFVAPDARGRGLARSLLRAALDGARDGGLTAVLDVGKEFTAAIGLYESEGWERLGGYRQVVGGTSYDVWVYLSPGVQVAG